MIFQGRRQLLTTGGLIYEKYSIRSNTVGGLRVPRVPGRALVGVQGAKPPKALKSLQSTLPEVVKKSSLVGHFFYVLHLKVTEKIIKIQNKLQTFSNQCRLIPGGRLHSFIKVIKFY